MMDTRPNIFAGILLAAVLAGGCAASAPTALSPRASVTSSPPPAAATFDDFVREACSAFAAMEDAVGNPDTGEGSDLTDALEKALEAQDRDAAARAGAAIDEELKIARGHATAASGWEPGARMMGAFDRFLAAFQAQVTADVRRGSADPADSQQTFEQAGGVDAWTDMLDAYQEVMTARPAGTPARECPGVPMQF